MAKRYPLPPPPDYYSPTQEKRPIDWQTPALVGAGIGAPVVAGVSIYGRGLSEQGVPRGMKLVDKKWVPDIRGPGFFRSAHMLGRELGAGTVGSVTGTMREGLSSYWRALKESTKAAGSGIKHGYQGAVHGLNSRLDHLIEFTAVPSFWAGGALKTGVKSGGLLPALRDKLSKGGYSAYSQPLRQIKAPYRISLHSRLDGLILFDDDSRKRAYLYGGATAVGVGGAGLGTYGLYRRGASMGKIPGLPLGGLTRRAYGKDVPSSVATMVKKAQGRRAAEYVTTAKQRGIIGNVVLGGQSIRSQADLMARMAAIPEVREAYAEAGRKSVSGALSKLARAVHK